MNQVIKVMGKGGWAYVKKVLPNRYFTTTAKIQEAKKYTAVKEACDVALDLMDYYQKPFEVVSFQ